MQRACAVQTMAITPQGLGRHPLLLLPKSGGSWSLEALLYS